MTPVSLTVYVMRTLSSGGNLGGGGRKIEEFSEILI
jgi:hypothetical protein